jgi:hypothetical protein
MIIGASSVSHLAQCAQCIADLPHYAAGNSFDLAVVAVSPRRFIALGGGP